MSEEFPDHIAIDSLPELLAHALAMETEAANRYGEIADQMETHHKTAVAAIFRRLEKAEIEHLGNLTAKCSEVKLPHHAPWEFKWNGGESPETIDIGKVNYRLSVRAAILLALQHEHKASDFYAAIARGTTDTAVRTLAQQFAEEEREHVGWLETCLAECGGEDSVAPEDPDPPLSQE